MAGGLGCFAGGILELVDLIDEHRAEFDYDWRSRFHLPVDDIGYGMAWDEALRLTGRLRRDPSSWVCAAIEAWDFPIDRAALATLDLFDLTTLINADPKKARPKPHDGRPFSQQAEQANSRIGNTGGRTRSEVVEILRAHGHSLPV